MSEKIRVVIADDHPVVRTGLRLMLDMDAGILGARDNTSYDLTLSSEKIRDKDMAVSAAEQEAKRAKARVNLNPKF